MSDAPAPVAPCDHCELVFRTDQMHAVVIAGTQSYLGHLLTNRPDERRTWLCRTCYPNLKAANIEGMRVEDDEEPR